MKRKLLVGLIALIAVLGTVFSNIEQSKAVSVTAEHAPRTQKDVVIGGETNYPHSTGACYCGCYRNCHPTMYYGADGNVHLIIQGGTAPRTASFICN